MGNLVGSGVTWLVLGSGGGGGKGLVVVERRWRKMVGSVDCVGEGERMNVMEELVV